jgi:hypothetical protein
MRKIICAFFVAVLLLPASDAFAKRKHVTIHKQPPAPSQQPAQVPVAVIPPLAMFYDLARRTNCQGDVLGLGGPGFSSPITPATGNVMTTAYMRGECSAQPKRY